MNRFLSRTLSAFLLPCALGAMAEPLLFDDFEAYTTDGDIGLWRIENPSGSAFTWKSTTQALIGKRSMLGGGTEFTDNESDYYVTLVSPELQLEAGKKYKVDFWWQQSKTATLDYECSDLEVRVREADSSDWTVVFISSDPEMCKESGVKFPWGVDTNWENCHSVVDISAFAGKKVEIGFAWHKKAFDRMYSNVVTIDDVIIEEYSPATGPVIESATTAYTFPTTWVGTTSNSEAITIKNTGKGNLRIAAVEGLEGTDFQCTLNPALVDIEPNDSYAFNVRYTPTVNGAATATLRLAAEGGNSIEIALKGTKKALPAGYNTEGFEDSFPPVGWERVGNWNALGSSFAGDFCAYVNLTMSPAVHILMSPRLDLSSDYSHFVAFSYMNQLQYISDDSYGAENYVQLELSTDGGKTWTTKWTAQTDDNLHLQTVELGASLGNNCYLRWVYAIPDFDPTVYDYEYTTFFLDSVVLPPFFGAGDAPVATSPLFPADGATDVSHSNLLLSWEKAMFAEGYKVYLGTASGIYDVVDGKIAEEASFAAPRLENSKEYFWKAVPFNATGEAEGAPEWRFTTMADQSVADFPWLEDFEARENELPLGWSTTGQGTTRWGISRIGAYDGSQIAFASGTTSNTEAILVSPEIKLPADDPMIMSFFWGNNPPAALEKDPTGSAVNTTVKEDGDEAAYLEINAGDGWKRLLLISEDSRYWVREAISLAEYAGKTVELRWRYSLTNGNRRRGLSLDNVMIQSESSATPAYFNLSEFRFVEANNGEVLSSAAKLTLTNSGVQPLTVATVGFNDSHFSCDIEKGTELAANRALTVEVSYFAGATPGDFEAEMTVLFTDGKQVTLPLYGTTLPADVRYFSFENEEHGSLQPENLVTIDVDKCQSVMSSVITNYPHRGEPTAFIVLNTSPEYADWRNVYPRSGEQVLAAFRTQNPYISAEDWIVSPLMKATDKSQFRFFGKSYATTDEFNDFTPHYFEVYVSTNGGYSVADLTQSAKKKTELAYSDSQAFTEYVVDLSAWEGQEIYVGLKHTTTISGYVAFFDDFYYEHFESFTPAGLVLIQADADDTDAEYYTLQGIKVDKENAAPGIYLRRSSRGTEKVIIR